jgi:hypothetical protein
MRRLDHVVLHVRAKPVLRAKEGDEVDCSVGEQEIDDMKQPVIDRRRIADEADALAAERARLDQPCRAECHVHA